MAKNQLNQPIIKAIEKHAYSLGGAMEDYNPIIEAAADKQFVFIGASTHGTAEFYRTRAEITQRLIEEHGFHAVAIEADWPDAYNINKYVCGLAPHSTPEAALSAFERFPTWMWRNAEVVKFIQWLYAYNHAYRISRPGNTWPVGLYGLDLYSLNTSVHAVINYLDKIDPIAASLARTRYSCLDHFMETPQAYGYATELGLIDSCEREVILQLADLRDKHFQYTKTGSFHAEDDYFYAEQNAKLVRDAEKYYRSLFSGRPSSWNVRDQHMFETLQSLDSHISKRIGKESKIIVWAHNSHIGNAAATEMSERGEFNIGQLARYSYKETLLIGFSTCRGTVTTASDWDSHTEKKRISEPFPGSYEEIFHHVSHKKFFLNLQEENEANDLLTEARLLRAIGVIYSPDTERQSHYFLSCLPQQFDFIIHYDETTAVEAL